MAYMVCAMQHEGAERERGKEKRRKEGGKGEEGVSEGKAWKVSGPIGHSEGSLPFGGESIPSWLVLRLRALASLLAALERLWFSKRGGGGVAMHHAL